MLASIFSALLGGITGALLVLSDRDRLIRERDDLRRRNTEVNLALRAIEARVSKLHEGSRNAECAQTLHEICKARMLIEE